jgi:hypothetical protein
VAAGQDLPLRRVDDPADDADKGRLPGAVRAEQREDLAVPDLQVYVLERPKAEA